MASAQGRPSRQNPSGHDSHRDCWSWSGRRRHADGVISREGSGRRQRRASMKRAQRAAHVQPLGLARPGSPPSHGALIRRRAGPRRNSRPPAHPGSDWRRFGKRCAPNPTKAWVGSGRHRPMVGRARRCAPPVSISKPLGPTFIYSRRRRPGHGSVQRGDRHGRAHVAPTPCPWTFPQALPLQDNPEFAAPGVWGDHRFAPYQGYRDNVRESSTIRTNHEQMSSLVGSA